MSGGLILGAGSAAATMTPAQRAQVIYTEARAEMSDRLWQAAIGGGSEEGRTSSDPLGRPRGLDGLLALLQGDEAEAGRSQASTVLLRDQASPRAQGAPTAPFGPGAHVACAPAPPHPRSDVPADLQSQANASADHGGGRDLTGGERGEGQSRGGLDLHGGPNARYAPMLREAASRTGLPPAALATIVHAEAARGSDGRWLAYSRNPRSSAAGLGQFLNGTWIGEAERAGTWLNAQARERGWLDARGRVDRHDRGELLALRYDPRASIEATADLARANLDAFERRGIRIGASVEDIARTAYLGHHLGRGDATRFLTGQLDPARARVLLDAQIGRVEASRRVAAAGSAVVAHRSWLLGYVDRHIQPARFEA